ncbi:MAG: acyl-CoA dehydrogenase family protein [Ilumatobacter sp.]|uniref:acyl-CoA dehydrogenase family protein n=1 Tax=Ilumatobacter sp. TaxID=1967498 RepID=UPI00329859E4
MDLRPSDDPRRVAVRSWLAEHPAPTRGQLGASGYLTPHWPAPWGLDADPEHQLIIDDELRNAPSGPVETFFESSTIGLGWAGPTILEGGTPAQRDRWLPGILDGSETWTQLFSEPESGSDLASLRISARRDGDAFVITGQKVWSTWANTADWGILLARTGDLAEKQRGISYFCVDMTLPGIEVRPIIEMTGGNHFNETWFDEVRVPADCLIGDEGDGWRLAKVTLGAERLSLSEGGVLWGMGPTAEQCFDHLRANGSWDDPIERQRFASLWTDAEIIRLLSLRMLSSAVAGVDPSSFASIRKCLADVFGQDVLSLVKDRRGAAGMLGTQDFESEHDDVYHWGYLFSRALTIGGGTSEVQRNIIGERLLGLPREPPPAAPTGKTT